jgi:hypothetical protein
MGDERPLRAKTTRRVMDGVTFEEEVLAGVPE